MRMVGPSYYLPSCKSRVILDAMRSVKSYLEGISLKNTAKPSSYKLDAIAKRALGVGKDDLSIAEMRKCWERGDVNVIAKYCHQDALLPLQILSHYRICHTMM